MKRQDLTAIRQYNQQLHRPTVSGAADLVEWMGAMQAQDFTMAKWALGIRLPGSTDSLIEKAFNKGEIVRTHLLRPTWHFVAATDLQWMLDLTAERVKSAMKSSGNNLELTEAIYKKSNTILEKALRDGEHLTREELMAKLQQVKIDTSGLRSSYLMMRAELDGIVCSGSIKNKKQTYGLLASRVPATKKITRDEALAKLATRYFQSHSPATIADFSWWSGLTLGEAKKGVNFLASNLHSVIVNEQTYYYDTRRMPANDNPSLLHLLPAYDEFLISYKDRTASLSQVQNKLAISTNGIFYPVIVFDGEVIGTWKRASKKDKITIHTNFFAKPTSSVLKVFKNNSAAFDSFTGKVSEVFHNIDERF
jgi:hypothetical protein